MRRFICTLLTFSTMLAVAIADLHGQNNKRVGGGSTSARKDIRLRKLPVPASHARTIASKLNLQFRDVPGVQISPDARNEQLVVMAPEATQQTIANEVKAILASHLRGNSSRKAGPVNANLTYITWREFEDNLRRLAGGPLAVTTSRNGERAAFQLTGAAMQGTTIEVDRRNNSVTVVAPEPSLPGWERLIDALDEVPPGAGNVTEIIRLENSQPAPIQRAFRLLRALESGSGNAVATAQIAANSPFRNAVFQQDVGAAGGQAPDAVPPPAEDEGGAGVIGDTQIQFVPELGTIIIRGAKRDVERVMEVIQQIEEQSKITQPDIEVIELKHADANAVAELLSQLYEDVLSARQGEVSITSLDAPNALLLIGRKEAIDGLKELINKIDQPVAESSRLRVFRLQNASAVDAAQTIRDFFADRPGTGDDLRPGLGPRVRVLEDYRTNSLIISAAPRDMIEVTRLINDLDVREIKAQSQIKVFPLSNAVAEDLAPIIQDAITGEGEVVNDNVTAPSTSLSIVTVDSETQEIIDSGILAGAVVTAETGANAIVVRAPAASMPLIGELIRQLDKAPGIESLVKVFTIQNGDATQLTTALQTLFGEDAGTTGTSVGAANLPAATAAAESSLVPLRFSTDIRTNSIVASGSASDLDVVESILLRLDSTGFAERITEAIWLRHQAAEDIALAVQTYVQQRTQTVNTIQQYQQGLGPYDLPDRDLIVVAEPTTNSLLLSVTPRLYEDVRRLIDSLDRRRDMVLIKVMIAEVRLEDTFEIGGEIGLQDSLLYDRGIAAGAFPGATAPSYPPGFDFNNTGLGLGLDQAGNVIGNSFGQGNLAPRGVTNFGVGSFNEDLGYGGFVLSAASDSINLLLRTLQDAGRLQILSRPQVMTVDNTDASVQVGRLIARVTDVVNNGVAGTQVVTEDISVGLILNVTPRVGADGLILMAIDATRSDRDDDNGTPVPTGLGDFVIINDILQQTAQSTIAAYSGQTVIFGGLIQKTKAHFSRRVPYVSEIPLLGHMFKYDQENEIRSELLIFMTPMLVTGEEDLEYVKLTESSRMSWCLADVVEAHGDVGMSGGNGLWGPALGNTIYPDLQPTVESVIIQNAATTESPADVGTGDQAMIDSDNVQQGPALETPASPVRINTEIVLPTPPQEVPATNAPSGGPVNNPAIGNNLPTPVAIPQTSFIPATGGTAKVAQSGYPVPPNTASLAEAAQASWSKILAQGEANADAKAANTNRSYPKPTRLGAGQ